MRNFIALSMVCMIISLRSAAQNVGINNAVPNAPLSFANLSGNKIDLFYNSVNSRFGFGIQTGLLQVYTNVVSSDIALGYGSSSAFTEVMRVKGNGNVGIGTLTPGYKLDINGRMRLAYDGTNTAGLWFNKTDNTEHTFAGMKADTVWGLYNAGWKFNFDMENTRLGINAGTPQYPLTFQSVVGDKISLYGGGSLPNADHYGMGIQGSLMQLFTPASNTDIAFGYGRSADFTEIMRIKGTGKVGINTNAPEATLTVNSSSLGLMHTDGIVKIATEILSTEGAVGTQTAHGFRLRTAGATRMYISATGNIGMGTFTPSQKLHVIGNVLIGNTTAATGYMLNVGGKIIAEEVRVSLVASWPDYVFKQDYSLMPLPELERFIKKYHHLPNIPVAEKMEKEGSDLGEMQRKMMEKIEELTLYVIELKKEIDVLKKSRK